jgi:histidine phosphotransferase ChpT
MSDDTQASPDPAAEAYEITPEELAARLAARLCHDFMTPSSAITTGLDILEDPTAKDMRDDAMGLIATSARKLSDLLQFARVAFGASAQAESFDSAHLERLAQGIFAQIRPSLEWGIEQQSLPKPAARALLNLAQLAGDALPFGGTARAELARTPIHLALTLTGVAPRVLLHQEVSTGLAGQPLVEGLGGRWVQAFYLQALVRAAGGSVAAQVGAGALTPPPSPPA